MDNRPHRAAMGCEPGVPFRRRSLRRYLGRRPTTIRWKATNPADDSPVNFAVVLFSDGRIRFDYGAGNTGFSPVVGISYGRSRAFQYLGGYNGSGHARQRQLGAVHTGAAGYTDMGAYEFRGNSLDTTPPTIVSTQPIAVGTSGDTGGKINAVKLLFSEDVNAIDAGAAAVYELRKAGLNGFGSPDDVVYSLTPQYTPGSPVATLKINGLNGAGLPVGQYRLTVTSNPNTSIHDLAGLRLDGDANGGEGGNYVRTFSVIPAVADLSVTLIVDNPAPFEGMTVQYTVTVSDLSGPASVTGVQVSDLLPAGLSFVSATASAGSYDSASGVWSINSLALGGSETLRITAKIPVGLAYQTLTNTAALAFVDQGDTNAGNDAASVSFTVKPSADLALTISGGNSPREGDLQYYSLTIDNNAGPAAATGVQVTDLLPAGLRFVSSSPASGTSYDPVTGIWTVGTLAKGASRTLQIITQIVGAAGQTITNTASITAADQFDYKTNNNTASTTATIVDAPLFASGKNITAVEGASFTQVVASFVDGDPNAQASYFTTTINWGDSTSSVGHGRRQRSGRIQRDWHPRLSALRILFDHRWDQRLRRQHSDGLQFGERVRCRPARRRDHRPRCRRDRYSPPRSRRSPTTIPSEWSAISAPRSLGATAARPVTARFPQTAAAASRSTAATPMPTRVPFRST